MPPLRDTEVPRWASTLTRRACKRMNVPVPPIRWQVRNDEWSSGVCYYGCRVVIRAGTDPVDAKLVLLHELAHWACPSRGHTHQFWLIAMRLFKHYGIDHAYALKRSREYRTGAVKAFRKVFRSQRELAA